jgi:hypothetical protein
VVVDSKCGVGTGVLFFFSGWVGCFQRRFLFAFCLGYGPFSIGKSPFSTRRSSFSGGKGFFSGKKSPFSTRKGSLSGGKSPFSSSLKTVQFHSESESSDRGILAIDWDLFCFSAFFCLYVGVAG